MVWVPRPRIWTAQPQSPPRLASSGIAQRLIYWTSLHPGARWGTTDLVSRREMGRNAVGGSAMVAGQRLHDFLGGTNFTFDTPAKLQSGRPFAVTWLQKPGTQTNAYPFPFSLHIGGSDHFAVFQSPSDSSYSFIIGRLGSSAISFASAVGLMTSGTVDRYLVTSSGGPLSGTASDWTLWRNGERLTAGGNIATGADSGSGGKIGANLGGTYPYTGQLGDFGLFDGVPPPGEIREFFRNPHGVYAPRRGFVFLAASGGGASASLAATGASGTFDATANSPATAALASTGAPGTLAATASSEALATLSATGATGALSATANSPATAVLAGTGSSGELAASAGASTSASLAATGASGDLVSSAYSPAVASLVGTGASGTLAASAGSGTSAALAATGASGTLSASAYTPATASLAALGGEGAFAGSAYPLTSSELAALGASGALSATASTVATATAALTGASGDLAAAAWPLVSAALAATGASGTLAASASVSFASVSALGGSGILLGSASTQSSETTVTVQLPSEIATTFSASSHLSQTVSLRSYLQ
jgi:hypothetical protein